MQALEFATIVREPNAVLQAKEPLPARLQRVTQARCCKRRIQRVSNADAVQCPEPCSPFRRRPNTCERTRAVHSARQKRNEGVMRFKFERNTNLVGNTPSKRLCVGTLLVGASPVEIGEPDAINDGVQHVPAIGLAASIIAQQKITGPSANCFVCFNTTESALR